jgi:hypothetical protein
MVDSDIFYGGNKDNLLKTKGVKSNSESILEALFIFYDSLASLFPPIIWYLWFKNLIFWYFSFNSHYRWYLNFEKKGTWYLCLFFHPIFNGYSHFGKEGGSATILAGRRKKNYGF